MSVNKQVDRSKKTEVTQLEDSIAEEWDGELKDMQEYLNGNNRNRLISFNISIILLLSNTLNGLKLIFRYRERCSN